MIHAAEIIQAAIEDVLDDPNRIVYVDWQATNGSVRSDTINIPTNPKGYLLILNTVQLKERICITKYIPLDARQCLLAADKITQEVNYLPRDVFNELARPPLTPQRLTKVYRGLVDFTRQGP